VDALELALYQMEMLEAKKRTTQQEKRNIAPSPFQITTIFSCFLTGYMPIYHSRPIQTGS